MGPYQLRQSRSKSLCQYLQLTESAFFASPPNVNSLRGDFSDYRE